MNPFLTLCALILAGCLSTEPETRTISCGTLALEDTIYDDPVPDTFAVVGGKCKRP
jgi:hypothetical protein